jgi:hypothetical protein
LFHDEFCSITRSLNRDHKEVFFYEHQDKISCYSDFSGNYRCGNSNSYHRINSYICRAPKTAVVHRCCTRNLLYKIRRPESHFGSQPSPVVPICRLPRLQENSRVCRNYRVKGPCEKGGNHGVGCPLTHRY